jgi:putative ABC transport system substrate-binding protein
MQRRHATFALSALVVAAPAARVQPAPKVYRIGFLGLSSATDYAAAVTAFREGLRGHGYEEGRNLLIEYRWADGREERLASLAAELVRLRPDVLVTHASGVDAARTATSTIPIIIGVGADPVRLGHVKSLSRPGGNITGVASLVGDLASKRLEVLREMAPGIRTVALISRQNAAGPRRGLQELEVNSRRLGIRLRVFEILAEPAALDTAFASIVKDRPDALIVEPDSLMGRHNARIAAFAATNRLPAMGGIRGFVVAGGLVSYGEDFLEGWRVAARHVHRILQGAKPGDLPVEQPNKFELAINLRTAQALGLAVPASLLSRADEIIR